MDGKICVVGGTGMLGKPVVRNLLAKGFEVQVLTRMEGKARGLFGDVVEEAVGAVDDRESLGRAFEGCFGVHINLQGGPTKGDFFRVETEGARNIVGAAKEAGVQRISMTSGMMVSNLTERELKDPESRAYPVVAKHYAEEALRESGIGYTIFRPTGFTDTFAHSVRGRVAIHFASLPFKVHFIAGDEYGELVARSYSMEETLDKTYPILGPEALSPKEALSIYCEALHPRSRIISLPLWFLSLMASVSFNPLLRLGVTMLKLSKRFPEDLSDESTVRDFGPLKVTVKEYCRKLKAERNGLADGHHTSG